MSSQRRPKVRTCPCPVAVPVSVPLQCVGLTVPVVAADEGAEVKIEGDLKTMQGEWVSKDDQGESVWKFKGEHVSLKTPTRAYEMTIKVNRQGRAREAHRLRRPRRFAECQGIQGPGDLQTDRRRHPQDLLRRRRLGTAQGVQDRLRQVVLVRPQEEEVSRHARRSRPTGHPAR